MLDPVKRQLVWTGRLGRFFGSAAAIKPKNETVLALRRQVNALHLAVGAEANDTAEVLIRECRRSISAITPDDGDPDGFVDAMKSDARKSLNRVVNMIRNNYPSATEPKETVHA